MNKKQLIQNLKDRIAHNEECVAHHEKKHGEYVAKNPGVICSIDSEMADWHKGKIVAFSLAIKMVKELEDA